MRGLLRYAPTHDHAPKMLAARGTRLGLIPHPAAEPSTWVVLVEGPPDMISARSRGLPAIAVPGDDAWEREWAQLLVGRYVSVVFDCDRAGREAAARIAGDLKAAGVRGSVIDLARERQGGYDLTDWLNARPDLTGAELCRLLGAPAPTRALSLHAPPSDESGSLCELASRGRLVNPGVCGWSPFALGVARARIARTVPCDTWAAAAISRWESPSRPARVMACSYSVSASCLRLAARVTCRSTSPLSSWRARSSPSCSASAIALRRAPAVIAALAASATRAGGLVDGGWVLPGLRVQPVVRRGGDCLQLGRERAVGVPVSCHPASCRSSSRHMMRSVQDATAGLASAVPGHSRNLSPFPRCLPGVAAARVRSLRAGGRGPSGPLVPRRSSAWCRATVE